MNIFRFRPLCLTTVFFVITGFICINLSLVWKIVLGCVLLGAGLSLLFPQIRKGLPHVCIIILLFCALQCALSCMAIDLPLIRAEKFNGTEQRVTARVMELRTEYTSFYAYRVETEMIGNEEYSLSLEITTDYPMELGQVFSCDLSISVFPADKFSNNMYDISKGIVGFGEITSDITYDEIRYSPTIVAAICRNAISDFFADIFSDNAGSLMSAMLLGDRTGLSGKTTLSFYRAGITHLLALSGMHITILIAALQRILSLCRVHRRAIAPITLIFVWLYSFLVGMPMSILRAAGMSSVLLLGSMIRRERDALSSLAFSVLVILIVSPAAIIDIGFWLSVTATLGILICTEYRIGQINGTGFWRAVLRALMTNLVMTLSASLFTLPIVAYVFGEISLLSLPANLVFSPLMNPLIYLGILAVPLPLFRHIMEFLTDAYLSFLSAFTCPGGIIISLNSTLFLIFLLATMALVLFILIAKLKHPRLYLIPTGILACTALLTAVIPHVIMRDRVSFSYQTDDSSNDYVLIQNDGRNVLYISGYYSTYHLGIIQNFLYDAGVHEIDLLCVSHYHNLLPSYIDKFSSLFLVREIALPPTESTLDETYAKGIRETADENDILLRDLTFEHPIRVGDTTVSFMPHSMLFEKTHARSGVVFDTGYGKIYFASPGYFHSVRPDLIVPMLRDSNCDILLFGQHGLAEEIELPHVFPLDEHVTHIYFGGDNTYMAFPWEDAKALYGTLPREVIKCGVIYPLN